MTTEAFAGPRVAVVGCGRWGKNLARDFAALGALEAIVEVDPAVSASLAAAHGCRALGLDEALADPAIDGVVIAAPAALHHPLAKRALAAGKHVYVEKPLALSVEDGNELVTLADKAGRCLMVGHLLQYHPAFLALKEFVASGALGKLSYIYSNRLSLGTLRHEEDVLWSFAPHDISMILALAGEAPDEIAAFSAPTLHPGIGDVVQLQLAFANGIKGHIFCSWLHPFKEQRLVVVGERGMVVFEDSAADPADKLRVYDHKIAWTNGVPRAIKGEGAPLPYSPGNPLMEECRHFLAAIANGTAPRTDGREALAVLSVLERATSDMNNRISKGGSEAAAPKAPSYPGVTIHESAYVDAGVSIGTGTRIWHFSHILGEVSLGRNCNIGQNVAIGPRVTIGDGVKIQNNVSVYEGVVLEDGVFCGPSCVFTNINTPRAEISRKHLFRKTLVKRGATIGANATIVCGHELGAYCFIAAGAVVTKDVPAFALMAGVPAARIGWVGHAGVKLGPDLVCPETGRAYRQSGPDTLEEIV